MFMTEPAHVEYSMFQGLNGEGVSLTPPEVLPGRTTANVVPEGVCASEMVGRDYLTSPLVVGIDP